LVAYIIKGIENERLKVGRSPTSLSSGDGMWNYINNPSPAVVILVTWTNVHVTAHGGAALAEKKRKC
jgi:hypothetical protein